MTNPYFHIGLKSKLIKNANKMKLWGKINPDSKCVFRTTIDKGNVLAMALMQNKLDAEQAEEIGCWGSPNCILVFISSLEFGLFRSPFVCLTFEWKSSSTFYLPILSLTKAIRWLKNVANCFPCPPSPRISLIVFWHWLLL